MCPCSQNDPTIPNAMLLIAMVLGFFLLVQWVGTVAGKRARYVSIAFGVVVVGAGLIWFKATRVEPGALDHGARLDANWSESAPSGGGPAVKDPSGWGVSSGQSDLVPDAEPPATSPGGLSTQDSPGPEASSASSRPAEQSALPTTKTVVYYFHRTARCHTCLTIEAYAEDAVQAYFSDMFADGQLAWQAVNIEEPGNAHFEEDFAIDRQSVVVVELVDGEIGRWINLPRIWDLVDDEIAFQEYVAQEIEGFLAG